MSSQSKIPSTLLSVSGLPRLFSLPTLRSRILPGLGHRDPKLRLPQQFRTKPESVLDPDLRLPFALDLLLLVLPSKIC